jgi:hypothetical protein
MLSPSFFFFCFLFLVFSPSLFLLFGQAPPSVCFDDFHPPCFSFIFVSCCLYPPGPVLPGFFGCLFLLPLFLPTPGIDPLCFVLGIVPPFFLRTKPYYSAAYSPLQKHFRRLFDIFSTRGSNESLSGDNCWEATRSSLVSEERVPHFSLLTSHISLFFLCFTFYVFRFTFSPPYQK